MILVPTWLWSASVLIFKPPENVVLGPDATQRVCLLSGTTWALGHTDNRGCDEAGGFLS
jgi:hypothetical protein